jgi:hypothetical protein
MFAACAQGTVFFSNRNSAAGVDFRVRLNTNFWSQSANGVPIGGSLSGTGFTAQLFGGVSADASSFAPLSPPTTFRTGSGAGYVTVVTATLSGVPKDAPFAYVQMRVWDNRGGTINTWAQVLADPSATRGLSTVERVNNIGGDINSTPTLPTLYDSVPSEWSDITFAGPVPELLRSVCLSSVQVLCSSRAADGLASRQMTICRCRRIKRV